MSLEICPLCGVQDSIFVSSYVAVRLDGTVIGGRTEAFCNNVDCDQRYWYYPASGRITRRKDGLTYQEWRLRRADIKAINAMRSDVQLPPLVEPTIQVFEPARFNGYVEIDKEPRLTVLRRGLLGWYYYLRAAVLSPFRRKPKPSLPGLGSQTINELRATQCLNPIAVLPKNETDDKGPCMVDGRYHDKE